jgi:hypothetical protein
MDFEKLEELDTVVKKTSVKGVDEEEVDDDFESDVEQPVKVSFDGFTSVMNRFLDSDSEWIFSEVIDLGAVAGRCHHCHTSIRYEFWLVQRNGTDRFCVGSTCITKFDGVSKNIRGDLGVFNKDVKKLMAERISEAKKERNYRKFQKEIDFSRAYLKKKYVYSLSIFVDSWLKGKPIEMLIPRVQEFMGNHNVEEIVDADAVSLADRQVLVDAVNKLFELQEYSSSPFVKDVCKRLSSHRENTARYVLMHFSQKQIDMIKKIANETDISKVKKECESVDDKVIEKQRFEISDIIARMAIGEIRDFEFTNVRSGDARSYKELFEKFLIVLKNRQLSDGQYGVVLKCLDKYGRTTQIVNTKSGVEYTPPDVEIPSHSSHQDDEAISAEDVSVDRGVDSDDDSEAYGNKTPEKQEAYQVGDVRDGEKAKSVIKGLLKSIVL